MNNNNRLIFWSTALTLTTVGAVSLGILQSGKDVTQIDMYPPKSKLAEVIKSEERIDYTSNDDLEGLTVTYDDFKINTVNESIETKVTEVSVEDKEIDYLEYMKAEAVRLGLPQSKKYRLAIGMTFKDISSIDQKPIDNAQLAVWAPHIDLKLGYLLDSRSEVGLKTDSHFKPHAYYSYTFPIYASLGLSMGGSLGLNQADYRQTHYRVRDHKTQKYLSKEGVKIGSKAILVPELGLGVDFEIKDEVRGNLKYDLHSNSVRFGVSIDF